jgi:hypothetical protein
VLSLRVVFVFNKTPDILFSQMRAKNRELRAKIANCGQRSRTAGKDRELRAKIANCGQRIGHRKAARVLMFYDFSSMS